MYVSDLFSKSQPLSKANFAQFTHCLRCSKHVRSNTVTGSNLESWNNWRVHKLSKYITCTLCRAVFWTDVISFNDYTRHVFSTCLRRYDADSLNFNLQEREIKVPQGQSVLPVLIWNCAKDPTRAWRYVSLIQTKSSWRHPGVRLTLTSRFSASSKLCRWLFLQLWIKIGPERSKWVEMKGEGVGRYQVTHHQSSHSQP